MLPWLGGLFGTTKKIAEVVDRETSSAETAAEFVQAAANENLKGEEARDEADRQILAHLLKLMEESDFKQWESNAAGSDSRTYIYKIRRWITKRVLIG